MKASDRNLHLTEAQLQEMVVARATALGWLVYHTYDSRRSASGFPDLVLARDGVVVFAELKSEKGRITENQRVWAQAFGEGYTEGVAGEYCYFLWRPSDMAEIEKVLQ